MRPFAIVLLVVLAGCAAPPDAGPDSPEASPGAAPDPGPTAGPDGPLASGGMHVVVVGGTLRQTHGPEHGGGYVCDMAAQPFSANASEETLWYVPTDWHTDDPRAGDLAVIRLDYQDWATCWTHSLEVFGNVGNLTAHHVPGPVRVPLRLEEGGVRVGGVLLSPGQETEWHVNVTCDCASDGSGSEARYEGTLHVLYLGAWEDPVILNETRDLPPMDVPYWAEAHPV